MQTKTVSYLVENSSYKQVTIVSAATRSHQQWLPCAPASCVVMRCISVPLALLKLTLVSKLEFKLDDNPIS